MTKRSFLFAFSLLAAASASASTSAAPSFHVAEDAYDRHEVNEAEALYRAVGNDPAASPRDRAAARREMARILWLVDGKQAEAALLLTDSLKTDPDPCPAALLYGRVLNDGQTHKATPALLATHAQTCADIAPGVAVEAVRSQHLAALALPYQSRTQAARQALAAWHAMPAASRHSAAGARLRLAIGLAGGNGSEALAGWRDYFWLEDGRSAPQAFGITDATVEAAFRQATPAEQLALARLLLRAGFAAELRQFITDRQLAKSVANTPAWHSIKTYLAFRKTLEQEMLTYNRAFARGKTDARADLQYEARLKALLAGAARQLGGQDENPMPTLMREWGLWGIIGKTNGVMSLHLGHTMVDEQQTVNQDGRHGTVRLRVLDTMIANAFSGWLWDGNGAPGGWAEADQTIVQVRPAYTGGIEAMAAQALPGPARERALSALHKAQEEDVVLASNQRVESLPGLRLRLKQQALDQLAERISRETSERDAFVTAFRRAYWHQTNRNSITLHEGRHALDLMQFNGSDGTGRAQLDSAELEYRAKLSEIGLSETPRLAFSSIYSQSMEGASGHAIANRRIIEAYVDWTEAHAAEIADYDPGKPALLQLDKLTDDQLRAVARKLDPAASPEQS